MQNREKNSFVFINKKRTNIIRIVENMKSVLSEKCVSDVTHIFLMYLGVNNITNKIRNRLFKRLERKAKTRRGKSINARFIILLLFTY